MSCKETNVSGVK